MSIPRQAAAAYHWMGDCDGCPDCYLCLKQCSKPNGCKRRKRAKKKVKKKRGSRKV